MHSVDYDVARCLSVCPSVLRLSVTRQYCVETAKRILELSSLSFSHTILVQHYSDGDLSSGASNAGA